MKNKQHKQNIDLSNALLGISLLAMLFFNWKNIILTLKIPILVLAILLIFFYKYIVYFFQKYLKPVSALAVALIPISINSLLSYFLNTYRIRFDNHWFVLILIAGIAPVVYNSSSKIIAYISYVLFFTWFVMAFNIQSFGGSILRLLSIICLCGFIFGVSERISHSGHFERISQTWKSISIFLASIALIVLALNIFDNHNYFDIGVYIYNSVYAHGLFLLIFYVLTVSILLYNIVRDFINTKTIPSEGAIIFSTVLVSTVTYLLVDNYFVTTEPLYYTVLYDKVIWLLFNAVFILFVIFNLIFQRKNKIKVSFYVLLLTLFILSKYFGDFISNLKI